MDNFRYELSPDIPKQKKAKFYIITCIVLFFAVLFMLWYRSYELGKMSTLFSIVFGFTGALYARKKKKYYQEQLFWKDGQLYYVVVPYDQYVDVNETKYQRMEKVYHVKNVRKLKVKRFGVKIYGDIDCVTTNDINTKINVRESTVDSITIPNHFDNWEHFIQSLNKIQQRKIL